MSNLRQRVLEEHINKHYPNAKLVHYNDPESDLVFYTADALQEVTDDWFPLCCCKDINTGKAMYGGRKRVIHTYTEGETGAGKTTRFVMQSLLALSSLKVKPSFVLVDIHGEIIENLYNHLKKNGYDIKILNCDNPQRSNTYNPFSDLAKECLKNGTINDEAVNKIRKISELIQPVRSNTDPIWDQGARSYTNGCILDKFEDLLNGDIPEECLTIYNVIQNHYWLREALTRSGISGDLFRLSHYGKKGPRALSVQKMLSVTNNADRTRASYFGVVENHYDSFGQSSLYSLSSNNTIDIAEFVEKPTIIVIQSGSTKIGDDLISLLMNDIYTYVVRKGKEYKSKKLPRNIHCFLDEFANCNIAEGTEFIKMLTTSRKFGMYWHMILQCDAQLDRKFDENIGRIIRANCTEIFMGSHDYTTEVRFAKSCGQTTIESLATVITQQDPRLEVVDLMTPERLNLTEEGYVYVKSNRHPLTKTYIEAFYNCEEFVPMDNIDTVYPYNNFDYQQSAFTPEDLPPSLTAEEFELLDFLHNGECTLEEVEMALAHLEVRLLVKSLAEMGLVRLLSKQRLAPNVSQRHYDLYCYRAQIGKNDYTPPRRRSGERSPLTPPERMPKNTPQTAKQINDWLSWEEDLAEDPNFNDQGWFRDARSSPLFLDLEKHLCDRSIPDVLKALEDLSLIPVCLTNAVRFLAYPKEQQKQSPVSFPRNANILKFEILERYISRNDFTRKETWDRNITRECKLLEELGVFPESILDSCRNAVHELVNELTLGNILEIKKIIAEAPANDEDEDEDD